MVLNAGGFGEIAGMKMMAGSYIVRSMAVIDVYVGWEWMERTMLQRLCLVLQANN